jgi:hypothetical protein
MGMSYNFLVGPHFEGFSNVAFKLRPVGLSIKGRLNIEYNIRVYPSGFNAADFGKVPADPAERKPELVQGISAYYIF